MLLHEILLAVNVAVVADSSDAILELEAERISAVCRPHAEILTLHHSRTARVVACR